jgi:type VI protein secretion system component VasK
MPHVLASMMLIALLFARLDAWPLKYFVPWMLAWMFILVLMLLVSMMLASIFGRLDNWMLSQFDDRLNVLLDAADRPDARSLGQLDVCSLRCSLGCFAPCC